MSIMGRRFKQISTSMAHEEALVNLMPLIDVIFVVLVMFIIIAPMLNIDQVDLAEGTTTFKASDLKNNFSVHVKADNSIWINQQEITLTELQTLLLRAYQENPETSFQVFHDRNATFGTYQEIRNIGQKVGFERMDIILKPNS